MDRTRRRSTVQIAREIDLLGGDVDAFTTREYTGFYAHTLDSRFAEALDLLGDLAFEKGQFEDAFAWWSLLVVPAGEATESRSERLLFPDPRVDLGKVRAKP